MTNLKEKAVKFNRRIDELEKENKISKADAGKSKILNALLYTEYGLLTHSENDALKTATETFYETFDINEAQALSAITSAKNNASFAKNMMIVSLIGTAVTFSGTYMSLPSTTEDGNQSGYNASSAALFAGFVTSLTFAAVSGFMAARVNFFDTRRVENENNESIHNAAFPEQKLQLSELREKMREKTAENSPTAANFALSDLSDAYMALMDFEDALPPQMLEHMQDQICACQDALVQYATLTAELNYSSATTEHSAPSFLDRTLRRSQYTQVAPVREQPIEEQKITSWQAFREGVTGVGSIFSSLLSDSQDARVAQERLEKFVGKVEELSQAEDQGAGVTPRGPR